MVALKETDGRSLGDLWSLPWHSLYPSLQQMFQRTKRLMVALRDLWSLLAQLCPSAFSSQSTSTRACTDHTTCVFPGASHTAGEWVSTSAGTHHDRACSALTECDYGTQFESTPPTSHGDRACTALTVCEGDEWDGVWSHTSPLWKPSAREAMNHSISDESIAWMKVADFAASYNHGWVLGVGMGWVLW